MLSNASHSTRGGIFKEILQFKEKKKKREEKEEKEEKKNEEVKNKKSKNKKRRKDKNEKKVPKSAFCSHVARKFDGFVKTHHITYKA